MATEAWRVLPMTLAEPPKRSPSAAKAAMGGVGGWKEGRWYRLEGVGRGVGIGDGTPLEGVGRGVGRRWKGHGAAFLAMRSRSFDFGPIFTT